MLCDALENDDKEKDWQPKVNKPLDSSRNPGEMTPISESKPCHQTFNAPQSTNNHCNSDHKNLPAVIRVHTTRRLSMISSLHGKKKSPPESFQFLEVQKPNMELVLMSQQQYSSQPVP
ncbi:hypothetical protein pdam_00010956, partial [Pocillopora damicornis]